MRRLTWIVLSFSIFAILSACDKADREARTEPLGAAETFHWNEQPITFQPPPADWKRQKHNQGGLLGVWFTHSASVGERIYISDYYKVGRRSQRNNHQLRLALDDVVEETRFSTDGWPFPPDSFVIGEMIPDTIAGVPAYRLDFTLNTPERSLVGREYYFMKNNYLFEAAYLGLPVNLTLFERVVDTISLDPVEAP